MKVYCVFNAETGLVKCFKSKTRAGSYAKKRGKDENVPFDYSVRPVKVE